MRLSRNVNDWERFASIAAGAALFAYGARSTKHRDSARTAGLGLVARGLTGYCPVNAMTGRERVRDNTKRALGGPRGIRVDEVITINRPPAELYRFWRNLGNLPLFMKNLERVDLIDDCRSHWVAKGPAGMRVEWEAEVINEIESELIGWRSLPGSQVASAGSVHFKPGPGGGTELRVTMQYAPPAGKLGASLAWLAGKSPSLQLREDLRRLKQYLETGEAPSVEGQSSGRRGSAFTTLGARS